MLEKIVVVSNTLILRYTSEKNEEGKYHSFFATNNNFKVVKFYLDVSGDIFSLIGFLIYLEVIRLKCGKMNYNLKTSIIKRGVVESMVDDDSSECSFSSDSKTDKSFPDYGEALFRDSISSETSILA